MDELKSGLSAELELTVTGEDTAAQWGEVFNRNVPADDSFPDRNILFEGHHSRLLHHAD